MERLIKWHGLEHDSIEICRITKSDEGILVKSEISGQDLNMQYEVDISLTPFTNTLPINNPVLAEKETREIKVVYFDFSKQIVRPVRQRYTRLSADLYHYENVPNDFEADIRVDDDGLVVEYPGLFSRVI
ncbi:putative glycolipid-binding domain-containing protein [Dyadobacter sp. CY343]|uniref:putative glycolipid-binding domain-containing protein n=1 Tax=Dyadobacter sp. CY343 TaxID=2907299 RepID=UPI001F3E2F93|nr:putative glycolipid-binding domain-containing protein [Dyadobacter sp. CY343]MCE7062290.1 putative glycolipid-binding domain-containing protein [Dyadobacter sp. CY343]